MHVSLNNPFRATTDPYRVYIDTTLPYGNALCHPAHIRAIILINMSKSMEELMMSVTRMIEAGGNVSITQKGGCSNCGSVAIGRESHCRRCNSEEGNTIRTVIVSTKMVFSMEE